MRGAEPVILRDIYDTYHTWTSSDSYIVVKTKHRSAKITQIPQTLFLIAEYYKKPFSAYDSLTHDP